eukprot:g25191.t1
MTPNLDVSTMLLRETFFKFPNSTSRLLSGKEMCQAILRESVSMSLSNPVRGAKEKALKGECTLQRMSFYLEDSCDSIFGLMGEESRVSIQTSQENSFVPPSTIPRTISMQTFTKQVLSAAVTSNPQSGFICSDVLSKFCDGNISGDAISGRYCGHQFCRDNQDFLVKEATVNGLSLSKVSDDPMRVAQGIKLISMDNIRKLQNPDLDDCLDLQIPRQQTYLCDTKKGVQLPKKTPDYQPYLQDTRK